MFTKENVFEQKFGLPKIGKPNFGLPKTGLKNFTHTKNKYKL